MTDLSFFQKSYFIGLSSQNMKIKFFIKDMTCRKTEDGNKKPCASASEEVMTTQQNNGRL